MPQRDAIVDPALLASETVAAVASIGVAQLLLLMLLACAVESRLRGKLDAANRPRREDGFRDGLTRLPTRSTFEGTLAQVLQQADAQSAPAVVLHIALDRFKHINDNFGHQAGDAVLKCIGQRLRELGPPHRVARLGGDEFLMLLGNDHESADEAATHAQELLAELARPCPGSGPPGHGDGLDRPGPPTPNTDRAGGADDARGRRDAGREGGHGGAAYAFFEPSMGQDMREQAEMLRELRAAVAGRGNWSCTTSRRSTRRSGEITGAEALLRWTTPSAAWSARRVFVPLAERCGLIGALGDWVIDEACRRPGPGATRACACAWRSTCRCTSCGRGTWSSESRAALPRPGVNPTLLTCEITEIGRDGRRRGTRASSATGARAACTSRSTTSAPATPAWPTCASCRPSELKIDRSFVPDLETSADARAVVDAVVKLAQALGLRVVAEGVETEGQQRHLRQLGCDELQGYLFAKPMSANALALWAMNDEGPRSIEFRASLFQETSALEV